MPTSKPTDRPLFTTAAPPARPDWRHLASHPWVLEARRVAAQIVQEKGEVTSDDVQARLPRPPSLHPNAVGAVLCPPWFVKADRVQSKRPEAKGRWIHVWIAGPQFQELLW